MGVARPAVSPARAAAHAVVLRTLQDGAWADRALRAEARGLEPRDRALAKRLAFGAVQRRLTLDWVVAGATKPGATLEPAVRAALHLGLFQLLFLDGIAAHAAVTEAVELAKPSPGHRLVNAVLRRVARDGRRAARRRRPRRRRRAPQPPRVARAPLVGRARARGDARALLAVDNEPGELALRINTLVTDEPPEGAARAAARATRSSWTARRDLEAHPGWAPGRLHRPVARRPARRARPSPRSPASASSTSARRRAARRRTWPRSCAGRGRSSRSSATPAGPAPCGRPARACGPRT